jgi:hypothetical protein
MPGVQFGQQIDMNGNKITEGAAATASTDFVILSQLNALVDGFAQNVGDGVASTYAVVHNFSTLDVLVEVFNNSTGESVFTGVARTDSNTVTLTFGAAVPSNAYRVLILKLPA